MENLSLICSPFSPHTQLMQRLPLTQEAIPKSVREWYKDRHVVVTGGAGFIGSRVTEALLLCGANVTVLDDFSTGDRSLLESLQNSTYKSSLTIITGSICDYKTVVNVCTDASVIFHLAARVSVPDSWSNPHETWTVNNDGTHRIYEVARHVKSRVIFSSSAAVYGDCEGICLETTPNNPVSPYGLSKLFGEEIGTAYGRWWGITAASLRYFNVYGPRIYRPGVGVINELWHRIQMRKPIFLKGDGLQTRDFIFVDDVARANLIAGARTPEETHSIYNIGTGTARSLKEVLYLLTDQSHPIEYLPPTPGDIRHSCADCSRFTALIR